MLWAKTIPLIIVGIINIFVGLFVFLRDSRRLNNFSFFLVAFAMGGWVIGIAGFLLTNSPGDAFIWAKIYYSFPLLVGMALTLFSVTFPNRQKIQRKVLVPLLATYIPLALAVVFSRHFVTKDLVYHDWGKEIVLNKVHYLLYSLDLVFWLSFALLDMYRKSKTEFGVYRFQIKLFFLGFTGTAILGVFFNLILPWFGNYRLIHIGPMFAGIYIAAVSYSIIKHKMFDVRLIVARSLGYIFSIFAVGLLFGLIPLNLLRLFAFHQSSITLGQQVMYTLLAVVIAFIFQPLKRFFDKATNKVFYRDAYEPQALLNDLNKELVGNIELDKVLAASARIIGQTIKSEFCIFGIKEINGKPRRIIGDVKKHFEESDVTEVRSLTPSTHRKIIITDELGDTHAKLREILRNNNVSIVGRLTEAPHKAVEGYGYVLLGAKKSGNPYSTQDAKMLEIITDELVIAIQNALRFEEIENFAVTLQHRVEEATKQLRQTNEKLKQMDQTKDDFISMASHQLRTPLTSVKGYVSMVIDGDAGKISATQRKLLDQAFISSQRMVYLIADLLNVSRLKTGKFVIEAKPTNLAEVVESEIAQLTETAKGRNLELTYTKPKDFTTLMLDEVKIRQVIMNFADNAIYYTPAGGHIAVNLTETPQTVEFTVVDDGIGVPKNEEHHLFNKFYRAGNARKARPDGTGLGLFMAKKVVIAQGGAIIFKTQEGKGSTFGFSFAKDKLLPENYKGTVAQETAIDA